MDTMTIKSKKTAITARTEFLDVPKIAGLLTVSEDTVYELFTTGELPGRKVGRKWITTKDVLARWFKHVLASNKRKTTNRSQPPWASFKCKIARKTSKNE